MSAPVFWGARRLDPGNPPLGTREFLTFPRPGKHGLSRWRGILEWGQSSFHPPFGAGHAASQGQYLHLNLDPTP